MNFKIFFFKQKTAYEMRISDWSSDVCSSDLDRTVGDEADGSELIDLLADNKPGPETLTLKAAEDEFVTGLLDVLEPRARYAVEQRFGLNDGRTRSYREDGEELGVTAEAATRLVTQLGRASCRERGCPSV